jgi:PEP-CTERM motif
MNKTNQKSMRIGIILVTLVSLWFSAPTYAGIIYNVSRTIVNQPNPAIVNTVSGFIETDGTIGVLTRANILDYEIVSGPAGPLFAMTPANAMFGFDLFIQGTAFTATSSQLLFDFNGSGEIKLGANAVQELFCLAAKTGPWSCQGGPSERINHLGVQSIINYLPGSNPGVVAIATATVPAPATLSLMGLGLASMVFFRRRRRTPKPA